MSIISVLSQKGGVGKTTLATSIAREYANAGLEVLIADMDIGQKTATEWNAMRIKEGIEPYIHAHLYPTLAQVKKDFSKYDVIVFDGKPHSTALTLDIAKVSDIVILPTKQTLFDLKPQIVLAHQLVKGGVSHEKINFAFSRVGKSASQLESARDYLLSLDRPYNILKGAIQEQDAYALVTDEGKGLTETPHKSLRNKAEEVIQSIVDRLENI